jgi:hypothetical protein
MTGGRKREEPPVSGWLLVLIMIALYVAMSVDRI